MQRNTGTRNILRPTRRELTQHVRFAENRTIQQRVVHTQHTLTVDTTFKRGSRTGLDRKQSIKQHLTSLLIAVAVNIVFFMVAIGILAALNFNFPNYDATIPTDKEVACYKAQAQVYGIRHGSTIIMRGDEVYVYKRGKKIILEEC